MEFLERFAGTDEITPEDNDPLVANPGIERPLSLQVLFPSDFRLDEAELLDCLTGFGPELADVRVEIAAPGTYPDKTLGLIGWGPHVVKLIGSQSPFDADLTEICVRPAMFDESLKQAARAHHSHVLLFYGGFHFDPLEQYVALAGVATALARSGAILVTNAAARSAFPAQALLTTPEEGEPMEFLRGLPVPMLYCGFVKFEVEDTEGVWMRTFGNPLLELPDFAYLSEGHHQGEFVFDLFTGIIDYLRESNKSFQAGETLQANDDVILKLRTPREDEWYLESDGEMFVFEPVFPEDE